MLTSLVVEDVGVTIETLRISRFRHDAIRGEKPTQCWVVPPRAIIQQRRAAVEPLTGERIVRRQCTAARPHVAPRIIPLPDGLTAVAAVADAG